FSLEDTSQVSALLRQWTFTPNTVVYEGGTNNLSRAPMVRFTSPGIYDVALSVTTTAGTSAIVKEDFISVALPDKKNPYLGTNTDAVDAPLRVWPNPFSQSITVWGLSGRTVLTLMDLEGKILEEAEGTNLNLKLRPEKGAYILKVKEEGQSIRYFKLLSSE
ncbi:MAG: T9SS type A sorting domain-containing protein, partial [Flavobacteriales bacterium]|nr:T9SS type A sorting domain-containing protein [Flavobacteriales bacterium]